MSLEHFIKYIREGEPVSPGTPNRPLQQLDQNIQYLWNLIQAANLGSTVYARAQTINSELKVGQPVYFNATSARFEPAFAAAESDSATGYLVVPDQAQVWGIVAEKSNATLADILLFGYAQIDIKEAIGTDVQPDGSVAAGTWYLSGASAGRLTRQLPPVTIPVLKTNGSGGVYVNPSFVDFLENHRHYVFSLLMAPAGTVVPPATGAAHIITSPTLTTVSAKALISNVATLVLPTNHGYIVGAQVFVAISDTVFDGTYNLTAVTATTISYARTNVNVLVAPAIGTVTLVLPGWLPANHAIFGNLAPANAKFGYNLSQDLTLKNLYPPVPLQSACIQMQRPSIQDTAATRKWYGQQLMEDLVVIDRNGIWWMRDCYDEVPWPTNLTTVSAKSLTSNVATLTVPTGHGYIGGAEVFVAISDAVFDGRYVLTTVTTTTISYARTNADVAPAAATGAVTPATNLTTVSAKSLTNNVATLTLPTGHGYTVGNNVVVVISDAVFDGTYILTAVTATTISYARTDADVLSVAATGTATPTCIQNAYALKLYYTRVGFATDNATVSSLRSVDSRLVVTCTGQTTPASTGDLDIKLNLALLNGSQTAAGHIAIKTFNAETSTFTAGPITEGIYATLNGNAVLTSTAPIDKLVNGISTTVHHGLVGIGVTLSSRELISQLVRLDGVTEENYPVLYLGMPNSTTTSYIVKFEVPVGVPVGSKLRFRPRILGRATGTLPQLAVSYYKTARPTGLTVPVVVTQAYVALAIVTVATLTVANQAVEALSEELTVNPGDLVYIKVQRSPTAVDDTYNGELGIMQQVGVLT